jgi:zinc transport system substrate-binding protein
MGCSGARFGYWFACFSLLLIATASVQVQAQARMKLLVSIKPLALIAQEVAGDQAEISILLPVSASPHDYPLKMSDHKRLRAADLVLWIGPEMESFLARPLANLPQNRVMSAYQLPGLFWPEANELDHQHRHQTHHSHEGGKDPHIWLDPRNAALIAKALADRLAQLQPESAAIYTRNAQAFSNSTKQLDEQLMQQLAPIKQMGFAVYHEGYGHFVGRYSLHQVAYMTYMPERRPGAKHLQELRTLMEKEGECLFMEPYYKMSAMEEIAKSMDLRIGLLDPIGDQWVSSYEQLLKQLAQGFLTCLANRRDS